METEANLLPALRDKQTAKDMKSLFAQRCKNNRATMKQHSNTHHSPYSQYIHLKRIVECF